MSSALKQTVTAQCTPSLEVLPQKSQGGELKVDDKLAIPIGELITPDDLVNVLKWFFSDPLTNLNRNIFSLIIRKYSGKYQVQKLDYNLLMQALESLSCVREAVKDFLNKYFPDGKIDDIESMQTSLNTEYLSAKGFLDTNFDTALAFALDEYLKNATKKFIGIKKRYPGSLEYFSRIIFIGELHFEEWLRENEKNEFFNVLKRDTPVEEYAERRGTLLLLENIFDDDLGVEAFRISEYVEKSALVQFYNTCEKFKGSVVEVAAKCAIALFSEIDEFADEKALEVANSKYEEILKCPALPLFFYEAVRIHLLKLKEYVVKKNTAFTLLKQEKLSEQELDSLFELNKVFACGNRATYSFSTDEKLCDGDDPRLGHTRREPRRTEYYKIRMSLLKKAAANNHAPALYELDLTRTQSELFPDKCLNNKMIEKLNEYTFDAPYVKPVLESKNYEYHRKVYCRIRSVYLKYFKTFYSEDGMYDSCQKAVSWFEDAEKKEVDAESKLLVTSYRSELQGLLHRKVLGFAPFDELNSQRINARFDSLIKGSSGAEKSRLITAARNFLLAMYASDEPSPSCPSMFFAFPSSVPPGVSGSIGRALVVLPSLPP